MKAAAVIAEYNPFHSGHARQLYDIKHYCMADFCIVIMSGNFVQRGTPAIIDKFTRATWALQNGADIVFELPTKFATAGAEQFALGACSLLDRLGFIHMLCFGSETTDSSLLKRIAEILLEPPARYSSQLQKSLQQGKSYAAAREEALFPLLLNDPSAQNCLSSSIYASPREAFHSMLSAPNTILGIEYCKALKKLNSSITPVPMPRKGSPYHDSALPDTTIPNSPPFFASASAIRTHLFHSKNAIDTLRPFMPPSVFHDLPTLPLIHENDFSICLYHSLLGKTAQELTLYYEVSKDLAHRIVKYLPAFQDFSSFTALLKTKQIAHARVQRALLHILLSIPKEEPFQECQYLRLLGLKKEASHLLRLCTKQSGLSIITKPANARKQLSGQDFLPFKKDMEASQLYGFIRSGKESSPSAWQELKISPIIMP